MRNSDRNGWLGVGGLGLKDRLVWCIISISQHLFLQMRTFQSPHRAG